MKVGDFVHCVPHNRFGVIVEELTPIHTDRRDEVAERRLLVLYSNPAELIITGHGWLDVIEEAA